MSARFTAYFSDSERDGLKKLSRELEVSENFIVRGALREVLGMSNPLSRLLPVTTVTRNGESDTYDR